MSKSVSNNVFKKKTGIQNIQAYLESGRSITALEALSNFGIFRLASAIEVLRKRGMSIETEMKEDPNGKTYARYTLAPAEVPKEELKVGAQVRVTALYPFSADHGRIGTMQRILEDVPFPFYVKLAGDAAACPYTAEELEVI
jgi:hypothetical protein